MVPIPVLRGAIDVVAIRRMLVAGGIFALRLLGSMLLIFLAWRAIEAVAAGLGGRRAGLAPTSSSV